MVSSGLVKESKGKLINIKNGVGIKFFVKLIVNIS